MPDETDIDANQINLQRSVLIWSISLALCVLLAIVIVVNLGEEQHIVQLLRQADLRWIAAGFVFQVATYGCAALMWRQICRSAGYRPPFLVLMRMAVEMLSINQIIPVIGMGGNVVLIRAMRRLGMPYSLIMDGFLIEIVGRFLFFVLAGTVALGMLIILGHLTPVIIAAASLFLCLAFSLVFAIFWLLEHRVWHPPAWLSRWRVVRGFVETLEHISPERVRSGSLLVQTGGLTGLIFLCDAATLWAMMQAIGVPISLPVALVAMTIGAITSNLSVLPNGDLGNFEAACTATLALLAVPVAAALAGTLLLRGLTYWLPLIPGLLLARYELRPGASTAPQPAPKAASNDVISADETDHLLSSKKNRKHLDQSLEEAKSGKTIRVKF